MGQGDLASFFENWTVFLNLKMEPIIFGTTIIVWTLRILKSRSMTTVRVCVLVQDKTYHYIHEQN